MITVKLYGLLRIDSGIKQRNVKASCMQDVLEDLAQQGIDWKALNGCVMLVNGKPANKRTVLNQGDEVQLLSPVAGG